MKFFCYLFSFYLLLLACLSCRDGENFAHTDGVQAFIAAAADPSHQHDANENCSPFCICSCCHVVTFIPAGAGRISGQAPSTEKANAFLHFHIQEIPNSFWRPPKV